MAMMTNESVTKTIRMPTLIQALGSAFRNSLKILIKQMIVVIGTKKFEYKEPGCNLQTCLGRMRTVKKKSRNPLRRQRNCCAQNLWNVLGTVVQHIALSFIYVP